MTTACQGCRDGAAFELPFSMAFQPIVDLNTGTAFAYEALVRGSGGEGAGSVLSKVTEKNRYAFDQQCRAKAIELAATLRPQSDANLSINFMPNAVYEPRACIRLTLATASRFGFPLNRIIFEFTENEKVDVRHLLNILNVYKDMGFKTAIDDFGAGHSGLNLLAQFQPDIVKLDMDLIRGIDTDRAKRTIVRHTVAMLEELSITTVCEGIETVGELAALRDMGVCLIQGYVFGRPAFEQFLPPELPAAA
ncbi:EAL domain-containing protein [Rhizobium terrae]|uniref:EAL domain-containing protein n=1 Tax=Rhizobium terrae TaxID=2171756 RepID=UPI000E3B87B6|nr:EAL domain-containing protein [Rhizobium terrae]